MKEKNNGRPAAEFRDIALKTTLFYALGGACWILFSDTLLYRLLRNPARIIAIEEYKGWLFVGMTSILLYLALARSMGEIRKAFRKKGESEERFQTIFSNVPVAIWEVDLSSVKVELDSLKRLRIMNLPQYFSRQEVLLKILQQLKVLAFNDRTLKIFSAGNGQDLLNALDKLFPIESLPVAADALVAIADGKPSFCSELTVATLQGERRKVLISMPIPPALEGFASVPVSMMDISKQKHDEERLQLFESVAQLMREAVTITTAELDLPGPEIIYVNEAFTELTGYTSKEAVGQTPRMLQGPRTERGVLEMMRQALWQRRPFLGRTWNYRKDGSEFVMEWKVAPVMNRQFQVTHFVAVQREVPSGLQTDEEP